MLCNTQGLRKLQAEKDTLFYKRNFSFKMQASLIKRPLDNVSLIFGVLGMDTRQMSKSKLIIIPGITKVMKEMEAVTSSCGNPVMGWSGTDWKRRNREPWKQTWES